jgi:potassium efflux system protein
MSRFTNRVLTLFLPQLLVGVLQLTIASPLSGQSPLSLLPSSSEATLQTTTNDRQTVAVPFAQLDEARAALAVRVARLQTSIESYQQNLPNAPPPEELVLELELLKWIDSMYVQRLAAGTRTAQLQEEKTKQADQSGSQSDWTTAEEQSHSFLLLDESEDQLRAQLDRVQASKFELQIAQELVESARDKFQASETERRKTREAMELDGSSSISTTLVRQYELAQLKSRMAAEAVQKNVADVTILKLQREIATYQSRRLQDKVAKLRQTAVFTPQDLQQISARVTQVENDLRSELQREQSHLHRINQRWSNISQEFSSTPTTDQSLEEQAKTLKLALEVAQEKVSLINQVLQEIGLVRVCWRYRYEVANRLVSTEIMHQWEAKALLARERFEKFSQLLKLQHDGRQGDLAQIQKELLGLDRGDLGQDRKSPWLEKRVAEIHQLLAAYDSQLVLIKAADRLVERFVQELQQKLGPSPSNQWMETGKQWLVACWNYEITSIDDSPVTVSKVVRGLILLFFGYFLARTLSRLLGKRILPKFGLNESASMALQSVAFYLMLACTGFVAMELIHLPLTVFTFMGGAVAIGVGFGSQNVLNNFMSGLILLAERPIRVGDLIDIDGLTGTIEHVGARSTRVKTGANLEIIVPNSKFLENNVTNWTLSDARIRVSVQVGVAYGSSTNLVSRLLKQVIIEHERILEHPAPIVLFKDFADNSLNFEAHFWIHLRTEMDGLIVKSEIRHAIDQIFEQEGVVIAFPQRDVHLDMNSPLEVNLRGVHELEQAGQEILPHHTMSEAA